MPNVTSSTPETAEVPAHPMALPKLMKALRRPCSLTGVRSIAMPSTATSWVAANEFTRRPSNMSRPICSFGSRTNASDSSDNVSPSWAPSTQGRRRPIAGNWKRSITGPVTSLNAQGKTTTARYEAISPAPTPWAASHAGIAMLRRPWGIP